MDILVTCKRCGTENTVTISEGERDSPRCMRCTDVLMSYVSVRGYIYILSNPSMKGLLKIGLSTRSVHERVAELNSATGVPMPFKIEAYFVSSDPQAHEQKIHTTLAKYRVKGKEFFDVPLPKALQVVESVCSKPPVHSDTLGPRGPGWKSEYDN
jgi:hypothetical protein